MKNVLIMAVAVLVLIAGILSRPYAAFGGEELVMIATITVVIVNIVNERKVRRYAKK